MIGFAIVLVGVVLTITGLVVLFGPWAAVGSGVVLIVAGLLLPEEVASGKPADPPSGA